MDPQDLDQCKHCGTRFHAADDNECPECYRRLDAECIITRELQERCPWGGPLRGTEEAEIIDEEWRIVTPGAGYRLADRWDSSVLDRLAGYIMRKGWDFK